MRSDSMMAKRLWVVGLAVLAGAPGRVAAQPAPNPSFYLVNRGTVPISRVFATLSGQTNWGQNRLGTASVQPGANYPIRLPADGNCVYDVRVVWANGRNEERRNLNTCDLDNLAMPAGPLAPGARTERSPDEPSFTLVNRSRIAVNELYLSVTDDDSWGLDRLGEDNLPGGTTKVIHLPPGECVYDLRVVFANGEASEKRRVNLCQIGSLRVP